MAEEWAKAFLATASFQDGSFDTLYADTQRKHASLFKQHQHSRDILKKVLTDAERNVSLLLQDTEDLHTRHLTLEDEIIDFKTKLSSALAAPSSSTDKTLHEEIQSLHAKIEELQAAQSYFAILAQAEKLSMEATSAVQAKRLPDALSSYRQLVDFLHALNKSDAKGPGCVDFVLNLAEATFATIKTHLAKELEEALEGLDWPTRSAEILQEIETPKGMAFQQAFSNLLHLQQLREAAYPDEARFFLFPLEVLVQPLYLRFRYHFEGNRQTNRLDKPEWYFAHVLNLITQHDRFVQVLVQALLNEAGYHKTTALNDYIGLLLRFITRRLEQTVPALLDLPPVLAHTIFQSLNFDAEIKEKYAYEEEEGVEWQGTANTILGNPEWFEGWRLAEKKYTEDKFFEVLGAPDAWQINQDYSEGSLRPTNSALRLRDLFEQVTSRYRPLPLFSYRLAFLLTIQVPLLDSYHSRGQAAVDAIGSQQTGLMRAVPGALDNARLAGVSVLEKLVRVFVASKWFAGVLQNWSDDLFFLDLWEDMKGLDGSDLDEAYREALIRLRGKVPVGGATLFSAYSTRFEQLASQTEEVAIKHIQKEVLGELKPYFSKRWDAITAEDTDSNALALSSELTGALTLYSSLLAALKEVLPVPQLQGWYRKIATTFSEHLYGRIASAKVFSAAGGKQFLDDVQFGWVEAGREQGIRRPEAALLKLKGAAILLALPVGQPGDKWTFAKVVAAVWDDAQYSQVAEALGISALTQKEAQKVLKRRPECWQA